MTLFKLLFKCRPDLSVSMLLVNTSDLDGVTPPVSCSPDGKSMAKITSGYRACPGRHCQYDNGMTGYCMYESDCPTEPHEIKGHNTTLKCPQHVDGDRRNRVCCPFPGEENLLPGEENALRKSKKLC